MALRRILLVSVRHVPVSVDKTLFLNGRCRNRLILEHMGKIHSALCSENSNTPIRKPEAVQEKGSLHFWLVLSWTG